MRWQNGPSLTLSLQNGVVREAGDFPQFVLSSYQVSWNRWAVQCWLVRFNGYNVQDV
eukprot:NODE_9046_length_272_cov_45.367713_g8306_i0.p1 GENE.NODE_9046_length_272_cov_45.367713_g8306_i0~~NODE_9046_length_272_cov_45.367713_g8306_i0.p1  ORF type:complete len:57 (+),score=6.58 NODE_9046_length_272_cov_45.367713_g8306_i0:46-216(+)